MVQVILELYPQVFIDADPQAHEEMLIRMDMNESGTVTIIDIMLGVNIILGN